MAPLDTEDICNWRRDCGPSNNTEPTNNTGTGLPELLFNNNTEPLEPIGPNMFPFLSRMVLALLLVLIYYLLLLAIVIVIANLRRRREEAQRMVGQGQVGADQQPPQPPILAIDNGRGRRRRRPQPPIPQPPIPQLPIPQLPIPQPPVLVHDVREPIELDVREPTVRRLPARAARFQGNYRDLQNNSSAK